MTERTAWLVVAVSLGARGCRTYTSRPVLQNWRACANQTMEAHMDKRLYKALRVATSQELTTAQSIFLVNHQPEAPITEVNHWSETLKVRYAGS